MKRLVMSAIMEPETQNSYLSKAQALLNNFIGGLLNPAGGPNVPITAGGGVPGELPLEKYKRDAYLRHLEDNVYPELRREVVPPFDHGHYGGYGAPLEGVLSGPRSERNIDAIRSTWPKMAPMPDYQLPGAPHSVPVQLPEYRDYRDSRFSNSVPVPLPDIRDGYTYEQIMR